MRAYTESGYRSRNPPPQPSPARGEGARLTPSPTRGEGARLTPSPTRGEGARLTPSPTRGEGARFTPSPLVGEGWGGGSHQHQAPLLRHALRRRAPLAVSVLDPGPALEQPVAGGVAVLYRPLVPAAGGD